MNEKFATPEFPLRVSKLPMLIKCPMRIALDILTPVQDESGENRSPASDTGTAAHYGINILHTMGVNADEAVREMKTAKSLLFPNANEEEAETFVRAYARDPRNANTCIQDCEKTIFFEIDPHPLDKTKQPIFIQGTIDQIRKTDAGYEVWDYKTGKDEGIVILYEHFLQLAGYTVGLQKTLGYPVVGSGIIRARGYGKRGALEPEQQPGGVFFHSCLTNELAWLYLYRVRLVVAMIRRGYPLFGPGLHCVHCPYEGPSVCPTIAKERGLYNVERND